MSGTHGGPPGGQSGPTHGGFLQPPMYGPPAIQSSFRMDFPTITSGAALIIGAGGFIYTWNKFSAQESLNNDFKSALGTLDQKINRVLGIVETTGTSSLVSRCKELESKVKRQNELISRMESEMEKLRKITKKLAKKNEIKMKDDSDSDSDDSDSDDSDSETESERKKRKRRAKQKKAKNNKKKPTADDLINAVSED
jgi:hypothetical protein